MCISRADNSMIHIHEIYKSCYENQSKGGSGMNDWKNYMWDDFIKREELESSPGIIDGNMIRALTLNT